MLEGIDINAEKLDIAGITLAFEKDLARKKAAYNPETLKRGDIVEFYHRPYQHCACMKVIRVKRATFDAVEINTSYKPGTIWNVRLSNPNLRMSDRKELTPSELANQTISTKLRHGGYDFTTSPIFSNDFHGTFYGFTTLRKAENAIKYLKKENKGWTVESRNGKYGFTLY